MYSVGTSVTLWLFQNIFPRPVTLDSLVHTRQWQRALQGAVTTHAGAPSGNRLFFKSHCSSSMLTSAVGPGHTSFHQLVEALADICHVVSKRGTDHSCSYPELQSQQSVQTKSHAKTKPPTLGSLGSAGHIIVYKRND